MKHLFATSGVVMLASSLFTNSPWLWIFNAVMCGLIFLFLRQCE